MTTTPPTAIELLTQIRDVLVDIRDAARARNAAPRQAPPAAEPDIAPDRTLDSKSGDPVGYKTTPPRDWPPRPSYAGKKLSECPPELLDMLAKRHDYFAEQAEISGEMDNKGEKPKSYWERLNAARARGWAQRIRSGWKPTAKPSFEDAEPFGGTPDDRDIPF